MVIQITIPATRFAGELPQGPFQSQQSFVQRLLRVTVTLQPSPQNNQPPTFQGTGVPGADGTNQVVLSGSRTSVRIQNSGAFTGNTATVSIWGLTQSLMMQLSTLGIIFNSIARNSILVEAGDFAFGFTPVFSGTIINAYGDFNQAPDVPFMFSCQAGTIAAVLAASPATFTGPTSVAQMMSGFARLMGVGFENNGITAQISNPYYPGNVWTQVRQLADHVHINADLVDGGVKLAIWPIGGSRTSLSGNKVPKIAPPPVGQMIGYPSFAANGQLAVKSIFDPTVAFGGTIQVQSSLSQANKAWVVQKLDLALDSLIPKGKWELTAMCYPLGFAAPIPAGA